MDRYQCHVLKTLKRHAPRDRLEDLAQEVFVRVYRSLGKLKKTENIKAWLSTIAVRACYDFWREQYRKPEIPMSSLGEERQQWLMTALADESESSWSKAEGRENAREILDWALGKLSAEDRMVVELVYLEGRSGREAAQLLGWSVANVKVRAFRSRSKLRKMILQGMENDGGGEHERGQDPKNPSDRILHEPGADLRRHMAVRSHGNDSP